MELLYIMHFIHMTKSKVKYFSFENGFTVHNHIFFTVVLFQFY